MTTDNRHICTKDDPYVIGKIPLKDEKITVNGLKYKVVSSDPVKSNFRAKILKSKK